MSIVRKTNKLPKLLLFCLISFSLILSAFPLTAQAEEIIYHEQRFEEPIVKGVNYVQKIHFTSLGWQKIHVLTVDLHNSNLAVDTLLSSNGLSNPQALSKMAAEAEAIAGINGDFFYLGQTNAPLGLMVKNGELVTTPFWSDQMSVFALTNNLNAILGSWNWKGEIIGQNGVKMSLGGINKTVSNYEQTIVYNSNWGEKLDNYNFSLDNTTVLTVNNDLVTHCQLNPSEILIPKEGYILVAQGETASRLQQNFPLGCSVIVNQSSEPDFNNIKMAIGGGTNIVHEGVIPPFTHNVSGKHQRTALGITKDGKYLFLVVVDGRNEQYTGMTQEQLAKFMQSIGSYYAINLDGGGSSTFVARSLGETEITVKNSLVEGSERPVPNGLGIFSSYPQGQLSGLKIETDDPNIPLWGVREFRVKGYDQYFNPIPVDHREVKWSVSNNLGKFEGNLFGSTNSGKAVVTAQIGKIKASLPIRIIDRADKVIIEPDSLSLSPGEKKQLTIKVADQNGFRASLSPPQIFPELSNNLGKMDGTTFLAGNTPGTGILKIKYDQAEGYCRLAVGQNKQIIEDFETPSDLYFASYPAEVQGGYEKSDFAKNGSSSGKLQFSFQAQENTQAAYLVFGPEGKTLPKNSKKLGVWIYNSDPNNHWLRAQIRSKTGSKKSNLDLAKQVDWEGWKYVETNLPDDSEQVLERIYLVETDQQKMNEGFIYLDDLTVTLPLTVEETIPATKPDQNLSIQDLKKSGQNSFLFSTATTAADGISSYKDQDFSLVLTAEGVTVKRKDGIIANKHLPGKKYGSFGYQNSRFILLDTTKGSIRTSDSEQWNWLINEMNLGGCQNLFVISPASIKQTQDQAELDLLLDLLAKTKEQYGQKIWIVSPENESGWDRRNGVHLVYLPQNEEEATCFLVREKTIKYKR